MESKPRFWHLSAIRLWHRATWSVGIGKKDFPIIIQVITISAVKKTKHLYSLNYYQLLHFKTSQIYCHCYVQLQNLISIVEFVFLYVYLFVALVNMITSRENRVNVISVTSWLVIKYGACSGSKLFVTLMEGLFLKQFFHKKYINYTGD